MVVEPVAEDLHGRVGGAVIGEIRDTVESDQVHAALQPAQQADEGVRVALVVVEAGEHRIFKTHAALAAEVVLADEIDDLADVPCLLRGHHFEALLRERIVEADRQVAPLLVEVAPERREDAYRAEGDALGAPGKAPRRRQDLDDFGDGIVVVQRLAHAHEDGVGEVACLVDAEELIENVRCVQLSVEAVAARHAELAAHLAPGLRADAEGFAILIRNHDRLDIVVFADLEEIFFGAVGGDGAADGLGGAEIVFLRERFLGGLGDVDHPVPVRRPLGVQPVRELRAHEGLQPAAHRGLLQLLERLPKQSFFHQCKNTKKLANSGPLHAAVGSHPGSRGRERAPHGARTASRGKRRAP